MRQKCGTCLTICSFVIYLLHNLPCLCRCCCCCCSRLQIGSHFAIFTWPGRSCSACCSACESARCAGAWNRNGGNSRVSLPCSTPPATLPCKPLCATAGNARKVCYSCLAKRSAAQHCGSCNGSCCSTLLLLLLLLLLRPTGSQREHDPFLRLSF